MRSPFTVYVITVRKGNAQWQVFRRYKEWEELRARLQHRCGGAPPMPGKMLFGRMRPEVCEAASVASRSLCAYACARLCVCVCVFGRALSDSLPPATQSRAAQVIETRVLGLNHFLQMVLSSPLYAASEDVMEFLEYEKNMPPPVSSRDPEKRAVSCGAPPTPNPALPLFAAGSRPRARPARRARQCCA